MVHRKGSALMAIALAIIVPLAWPASLVAVVILLRPKGLHRARPSQPVRPE